MTALIVIPARMAASRLPGKPMADIDGKPMIVHVWERAIECGLGEVVVATDHKDIVDAIVARGGKALLTRNDHPSGSDRIAEALQTLDQQHKYDLIVNIQGDLPALPAHVARAAVAVLENPIVQVGTAIAPVTTQSEANNPSIVKFVGTQSGPNRFRALYFSRACVPWGVGPLFQHIGIYVWRRPILDRFLSMVPSKLELREKLEQLRLLEAGFCVEAALVETAPIGVDTPEDLVLARRALSNPALI